MVKDGVFLLPEFLCHYSNIADKIYLIDHNSQYNLASVNGPKIEVVRSDQYSYLQEECTNLVVEHFNIKDKYDWLFVLDVDEFLPFTSRNDLELFLSRYRNNNVISYPWVNGLAMDGSSQSEKKGLINVNQLLFYKKSSSSHKCAVNISKTKGNFFIPRSCHNIAYFKKPIWHRLLRGPGIKYYHSIVVNIPLYHIVSTGKKDFEAKIDNFKQMRRMMDGVSGIGGSLIYSYPEKYSVEDLLRYVANYRVGQVKDHIAVTMSDFSASFNLSHIDKTTVDDYRNVILGNNCKIVKEPDEIESKYLLEKKLNNNYFMNKRWFFITNKNEIMIRAPK